MNKKFNKKIVEKAAVQLAELESAAVEVLCDSEFNKEFGKTALSGLKSSCNNIRKVRNKLEELTGETIFFWETVKESQIEEEAFPESVFAFFEMQREDD